MANKVRAAIFIDPEVMIRLEKHLKAMGGTVTFGQLAARLIEEYDEQTLNRPDQRPENNIVEWFLRPGDRKTEAEGGRLWSNGGRWFLDWLLRSEPSWQERHRTMFPRHWPIQPCRWETRCYDNGGDKRSVNDHIAEHRHPLHENAIVFPVDLPDITFDEWSEVCRVYRGCCGERLRLPTDGHWDDVCSLFS